MVSRLINPLNLFGGAKDYILSLIIDQFIGKYVKNIRGKLITRIATGEIEVHGAELAQHALDQIKLPIGVRHGILGHLIIKNMFGGFGVLGNTTKDTGLHVVLSDLVLIVQPLSSFEVSEEHEKAEDEAIWEAKKEKLKRQVERWLDQLHRRYTGSAAAKPTGYLESVAKDLFRSMKIDIYRVHIMLEDEFSNHKRPYTMGVVIDSVKLKPKQTQYMDRTAAHDVKAVDDHSMTDVRTNAIAVENLRVYLNSGRIGDLPVRQDLPEWQRAKEVWMKERARKQALRKANHRAKHDVGRYDGRGSLRTGSDSTFLQSRTLNRQHSNFSQNTGRSWERGNNRDGNNRASNQGNNQGHHLESNPGHHPRHNPRHNSRNNPRHNPRHNPRNNQGPEGEANVFRGLQGGGSINGNQNTNDDDHHHHQKEEKDGGGSPGGSPGGDLGHELGDIYNDFGPLVAAQFRLMRTSPHHEDVDHVDTYLNYPDGPGT